MIRALMGFVLVCVSCGDPVSPAARAIVISEQARALAMEGNLQKARLEFDRAITLDPKAACHWADRAVVRSMLKDTTGAIEDCSEALRLDPRFTQALRSRASEYLKLGNVQAALQDLDRAIEIVPDYPEAYVNRSRIRVGLGQTEKAIEDLETALKVAPAAWVLRLETEKELGGLRPK